jgi:hypothetical protein
VVLVGGLQVRRERRTGLQVPEVFLTEASDNIVVKAESMRASALRHPPTARDYPSFYRPRGGSLQACRAVLATCDGVDYSVAEWTVVLANPASGGTSWRALYPSRSGFEGGGVGVASSVAARVLIRGCC